MRAPLGSAGAERPVAALGLALALALGLTVRSAHAQETGSDVQIPSPREMVSSASLGLVQGPVAAAPSAAAFAVAVQAVVTQGLVGPDGEDEARARLGNFRTSILIKAGVLSFESRSPGGRGAAAPDERPAAGPSWAGRPLVFVDARVLRAAARSSRQR